MSCYFGKAYALVGRAGNVLVLNSRKDLQGGAARGKTHTDRDILPTGARDSVSRTVGEVNVATANNFAKRDISEGETAGEAEGPCGGGERGDGDVAETRRDVDCLLDGKVVATLNGNVIWLKDSQGRASEEFCPIGDAGWQVLAEDAVDVGGEWDGLLDRFVFVEA
jgi:hypothetical protein